MAEESELNKRIDDIEGGNGNASIARGKFLKRYVAGVVCRERERLAEIFIANGFADLAKQIVDDELDEHVFRFRPPSVKLRQPLVRKPESE